MKLSWMAGAALAGAAALGALALKTHASENNSQLFTPARFSLVAAEVDAALLQNTGGDNGERKVLFKLDVAQMNSEAIDDFIKTVKDHPGKQSFSVHLFDSNMNLACNMTPFTGGVAAHEILPLVDQLPYADFELK